MSSNSIRADDGSPNVTAPMPTTLVLDQHALEAVLGPVLLDRGTFAVAPVRRRYTKYGRELMIADWQIASGLPDGRDRPPLDDWAVMVSNIDNIVPVDRMAEIIRPKRSHLVVLISLNPGDRTALPVRIFENGRPARPVEVRFIGPGLVTIPEPAVSPDDQTGAPDSRSSRTRGALRGLYDRLEPLQVLQLAFGRGGNELARQLVGAGVRHITGVDGDRIGAENLDAAPDISAEAVGEFKVVEVCRRLRRNQPGLTAVCLPYSVTSPEVARVLNESRFDTAFSFVDNPAARLALSQSCRVTRTIHIDVGTHVRYEEDRRILAADIRLFEPGRGCVACVPPMRREELDDALYTLSAPPGALHRGSPVAWNELRAGSLLHLNALACSLAVETWLSYLNRDLRSSHWTRVVWPSGEPPRIEAASVRADPDCRFCGADQSER